MKHPHYSYRTTCIKDWCSLPVVTESGCKILLYCRQEYGKYCTVKAPYDYVRVRRRTVPNCGRTDVRYSYKYYCSTVPVQIRAKLSHLYS